MGIVIDIVMCPTCKGIGLTLQKVMMHNSVYQGLNQCQRCKGRGRIGIRRKKEMPRKEDLH